MAEAGTVRSIGGIEFDVTVEERHIDTLVITSHPVQTGADISDHAYKLPMEVTIMVGKGALGNESSPREVYDKVRELQERREPIDITTGKRSYKNMLIKSVSETTTDRTENSAILTLECQEVILVESQTVSVIPSSAQKTPELTQGTKRGGDKQANEDSNVPVARKSILAGGAGSSYKNRR